MSTRLAGSPLRTAMVVGALRRSAAIAVASIVLVLGALATPMAHGATEGGLNAVPIDELKRVYLACGRAALSGRLDGGGIMQCSIVYEELKRRAFGGDFGRLLAWSKTQPSARSAGR